MSSSRFDQFPWVSESLKEKYSAIQQEITEFESMPRAEIKARAAKLSFLAIVKDGQIVLNTCNDCNALRSVPLPLNRNILKVRKVEESEPIAEALQPICNLHIYVPADRKDLPSITRADVAARVPQEYLPFVRGFSFTIEKGFFDAGFNWLADAYEYNIVLYGI